MIKVLIVDDSALIRKILTEELSKYSDIKVVGTAIDPYFARDKIIELNPDVIVLDLEMPRMDGLSFLSKLMKYYPKPVIVFSSLTREINETAIRALELGAVEIIGKPVSYATSQEINKKLVVAIRNASLVRFDTKKINLTNNFQKITDKKISDFKTTQKIIAIGSSTGGTLALEEILTKLPVDMPGIVIVQHMPPGFTSSFAKRLNDICKLEVKEAEDGDFIVRGRAFIAPGGYHMLVERSGANYYIKIKDGPMEHFQKPAVDPLFRSVAKNVGKNAIGVILTGMGKDGAKGMLDMKNSGAYNIAQDEETSLVFGMPKEAIEIGAVDEIIPLYKISQRLIEIVYETKV
ncbi:MAG: chemotaxis response regulator protein-glutamate methylesterase [Elusimicrobiales bacterium]|nr:chemotaxis response regulator protein-glutamate methylesterase [Elusimicrobiales bacterium]